MKTSTYDPAQWKLVPVEPTEEMLRAADRLPNLMGIGDEWRAMLEAAPEAPPSASEPTMAVLLEVIRVLRHYPDFDADDHPMAVMMDEALAGKVPTLLSTIDSLARGYAPEAPASAREPWALREVGLSRDVNGMCIVTVNGREAIRDNGDIISHFATPDWFSALAAAPEAPSSVSEPEANENAPWLTDAHTLCTDCRLPQGHISDRIKALRRYIEMLDEAVVADIAAEPEAPEPVAVAWVDVKDRYEGPYEFHGKELLDAGKHLLYTAAPQSAQAEHQRLTREHMNALHRAWVKLEGNDADLMHAVELACAKAWGVKLAGGPAA